MRNTVRDDYRVSGSQLAGFATINFLSANLIFRHWFASDHCSTGDDRGRTLQHIEDVRVLGMNLDEARFVPAASVDLVVPSAAFAVKKNLTLLESRVGLALREVGDGQVGDLLRIASEGLYRVRPCNRELFILCGTRRAAHTNAADNLSIEDYRDPALERREERVRQRSHRRAAFVDDVLKNLGRLLEKHGCPGFSNGDACASGKSTIEPFEGHQI